MKPRQLEQSSGLDVTPFVIGNLFAPSPRNSIFNGRAERTKCQSITTGVQDAEFALEQIRSLAFRFYSVILRPIVQFRQEIYFPLFDPADIESSMQYEFGIRQRLERNGFSGFPLLCPAF